MVEKLREIAAGLGFHESGVVATSDLQYDPVIRKICEGNTCRNYNTSWACPPAVGTLDECRARCEQFEHLLLLSAKYDLEDPFDYETMVEGHADFKKKIDGFNDAICGMLDNYQLLTNEGCGRCRTCTWPDAPCRFPDKLYHSIEGYGFHINRLAAKAGMHYINGQNTVTYFGGLLFGHK